MKTGVFTGLHATNPATGEQIPIWVADYVLMEYGTGAIMAVPAHDERDREFAETFGLPIVEVVTEDGDARRLRPVRRHARRGGKDGDRRVAGRAGRAKPTVSYRLRDWSFSRQRYWGCPIPIVYCDDCGIVPVPDDELPLLLPEVEDYRPKGVPPLASNTEWLTSPCPRCGSPATREADTMDTFVDSSWYFLRYVDPHNDEAPFGREVVDYWCPIDQYIGGIDHATGHLLYSRFFVKVMNELGLVGFREPFATVFHQGWVQMGGTKMSKSKGNVEGPDQFVAAHGADAVRLYILFLGPADQDMEWTDSGIEGIARFLRRLWRLVHEVAEGGAGDGAPTRRSRARRTRRSPRSPTTSSGGCRTTPPSPRSWSSRTSSRATRRTLPRASPRRRLVSLIQPYAPHIAEELWERARARAALEAAVAGGRPGHARARHVRAGRAGERQASATASRCRRRCPTTSWSSWPRPRQACRPTSTARRCARRSSSRASS